MDASENARPDPRATALALNPYCLDMNGDLEPIDRQIAWARSHGGADIVISLGSGALPAAFEALPVSSGPSDKEQI